MSFTECVCHFDISPLNPDTSPEEEERPNTGMFGNEKEYIVVKECQRERRQKKKNLRLFILTIEPVFQVDMSPLKDFVPLNTGKCK